MTESQMVEAMQDSRLINAADHLLRPLLEQKIQNRITLACARFKSGEKDFIADIAYIQGIKELQSDLEFKKRKGNEAIKRLDERSRSK